MKYNVTLAGHPICNLPPDSLPFIPGTDRDIVLDTNEGLGQTIWHGYLQMRETQKTAPARPPYRVELVEADPEISKFREAINLFFRFLAGEGRDNCERVKSIAAA